MATDLPSAALRLSACRALLGQVSYGLRLVQVNQEGNTIRLTAYAASDCDSETRELMSEVATEIISDFPECELSEELIISDGAFPREVLLRQGWVFARNEPYVTSSGT